MRGVVRELIHDPGRGAPIVKVQFNNPYKYKKDNYQWTATEGTYTGQFIYCGKKGTFTAPACPQPRRMLHASAVLRACTALDGRRGPPSPHPLACLLTLRRFLLVAAQLIPGNILPLESMPPGTVVNQVEKAAGDRSKYARTSGGFAQIIGHIENTGKTRLRLPSGQKKLVSSLARGAVGIVAGGGRIDKPLLKAGRAFHKYRVKRNSWPTVRGVAMNPVEHPHGGGNHQHIGHPSTVRRDAVRCRAFKLSPGRRHRGRPSTCPPPPRSALLVLTPHPSLRAGARPEGWSDRCAPHGPDPWAQGGGRPRQEVSLFLIGCGSRFLTAACAVRAIACVCSFVLL